MNHERALYCINCGRPGSPDMYICANCGASQLVNTTDRVRQVAVVLNELHAPPFEAVDAAQLASVESHYIGELGRLTAPAPRPAPRRSTPAVAIGSSSPPPASRPPRQPRDWSWLADQQANLLLFAGAFLTVIAALIYVGYNEQAVSGVTKIALFTAYTLAFIAAGALCLRIPRVQMAGQVFLGVGAIMVPLNFVTAYNVLEDTRITAEGMWLAGSITTALFYTAIALLGLGRGYSIASGTAVLSAALGAIAAFDLDSEWGLLVGVATAAVLIIPLLSGNAAVHERLGEIWQAHAHFAAIAAAGMGVFLALLDVQEDLTFTISSRWFLPVTLVAFIAFAAVPAVYLKRREFAVEVVVGTCALFLSLLYPFDAPIEAYVIALGGLAAVLGVVTVAAERPRIAAMLPPDTSTMIYAAGVLATLAAGLLALSVLELTTKELNPHVLSTRWYLAAASALAAMFYVIDAAVRRTRFGFIGSAVCIGGIAPAVVYALNVSPEYYAFSFIAPALAIAAFARMPLPATMVSRLAAPWREDAFWIARLAVATGATIAAGCAFVSLAPDSAYEPQYREFLPVALAGAAVVALIDATRRRMFETSLGLLLAVGFTAVAVPYVYDAPASHYGAALAAFSLCVGFLLRATHMTWLDPDARDLSAIGAVAIATLPFEMAYLDEPRIGAAVHFAAAVLLGFMAVRLAPREAARPVSADLLPRGAAPFWVYAAGAAVTVGYFFLLRSLPSDADAGTGSLATPFMALSLVFALAGVAARRTLPSLRMPLYVISLLVAAISLSAAADAAALAALLTVYVVLYAAIALYEDAPILGLPSAISGFLAVAAWREHLQADPAIIPIAFSSVGIALYAAGASMRSRAGWSTALRSTAAGYAIAAPAAGFAIMAVQADQAPGDVRESALYQWSTIAVFTVALLGMVEAALSKRQWVFVPGSAVFTVALLLEVARFDPQNMQPYTLIAGSYLVLLGAVLIGRFRLLPDLVPAAAIIEGLGAATIMFPTFLQSLDAGWRYQLLLFVEASLFIVGGIAVRRQGILAAGLGFTVLVGGRALFDALNALPNWIVAMIAGAVLLGAGMAILIGRDRWTRWQEAVLSWWDDATNGSASLASK